MKILYFSGHEGDPECMILPMVFGYPGRTKHCNHTDVIRMLYGCYPDSYHHSHHRSIGSPFIRIQSRCYPDKSRIHTVIHTILIQFIPSFIRMNRPSGFYKDLIILNLGFIWIQSGNHSYHPDATYIMIHTHIRI